MSSVIRIRRGTSTQWGSSTRVLQTGELGIDTTLNKVKAGNGSSLWSALPWITITSGDLAAEFTTAVTTANEYTDEAIASLGNTLPETYVPISDVGNVDGVAPLDENALIPDQYIPSTIARDSELFSGSYDDLTNKPILFDGDYDSLFNKPNLFSGSYDDLTNKPSLFSGSYDDLTNKPTIPSLTGYATETYVNTAVSNLVDSAPETLNTLNELAAALGDDANYATTISTALGNKLDSTTAASTYLTQTNASSTYLSQTNASSTYAPIASPTFTGTVGGITKSMVGLDNVDNTSDANKPVSAATQTALDLKLNITEPSVDYYVTNSGSGSYTVNGVANGLISFDKGKKYRIHVNANGHPFWIQTVSGGYSSGNVYNTGITNNGTQNGHILVELPDNAPEGLYYACQYHSSMAGAISVKSAGIGLTTNSQSGSYTLSVIDSDKIIEMSGGGTLTITDSTSFPIGFTADVIQTGSSQVTIAGNGFTPNATPGLKLRTQWSSATLIKRGTNSWVILGDLSA